MAELKTENEKDAKVKRRLAKELQFLKERESRGVKEKEVRRKNLIAVLIKWVSNSLFLCAFLDLHKTYLFENIQIQESCEILQL